MNFQIQAPPPLLPPLPIFTEAEEEEDYGVNTFTSVTINGKTSYRKILDPANLPREEEEGEEEEEVVEEEEAAEEEEEEEVDEEEEKENGEGAGDVAGPERVEILDHEAFTVFMKEFKMKYEERYPDNKSVVLVDQTGEEQWKSMSDFDKSPYVAQAEKKKAEYLIGKEAYNNKQVNGSSAAEKEDGSDNSEAYLQANGDEERYDKTKSEVNDPRMARNAEESGEESG